MNLSSLYPAQHIIEMPRSAAIMLDSCSNHSAQAVPAEQVFAEGPEDSHDVLSSSTQNMPLRGAELLYARFCPPGSRVPRNKFPQSNNAPDNSFDNSISSDRSLIRELPNATHASPLPPHRPTTPGYAQSCAYRSPSAIGEQRHADRSFGDGHASFEDEGQAVPSQVSPERANASLDNSFPTAGQPRRVRTPREDRLAAVKSKAAAAGEQVSLLSPSPLLPLSRPPLAPTPSFVIPMMLFWPAFLQLYLLSCSRHLLNYPGRESRQDEGGFRRRHALSKDAPSKLSNTTAVAALCEWRENCLESFFFIFENKCLRVPN